MCAGYACCREAFPIEYQPVTVRYIEIHDILKGCHGSFFCAGQILPYCRIFRIKSLSKERIYMRSSTNCSYILLFKEIMNKISDEISYL